MSRRYDTISFLSDYGHTDEFVGVVHSVIRSIAPHVEVVDLVHELAPFDIRGASLALSRVVQYVAPGIVLAIVDPGVATERRAIAVEVGVDGEGVLIGPDNGLLAPAVAMSGGATRAVSLENPDYQLPSPGPTFAGRDIFGPAAAHLASGVPLLELGPEVDTHSLVPGLLPLTHTDPDGAVVAEVLWIDRYGNCQLNVDPDDVAAGAALLTFGDGETRRARRVVTFGDLKTGELGLIVDSYGLLAIVADQTSAASILKLRPGSGVTVHPV